MNIEQAAHCRSVYRCHRQFAKTHLFHGRYELVHVGFKLAESSLD
ncbi:hypothetical protein [Mycetohabitans sp. B8]|nr:hypothetical protein [Mycetohabitans sp. B8]